VSNSRIISYGFIVGRYFFFCGLLNKYWSNLSREGYLKLAIFTFLMIAGILSWFKFNELFIQAFKELFKFEITKASYYFTFFCIGFLGDLILFLKGTYEIMILG